MKKAYYELAVNNPGAVAWHCALKLEMAAHLTKVLLSEQLRSEEAPGRDEAKAKLEEELRRRVGCEIQIDDLPDAKHYGQVDDVYVSFEWSDGGVIHGHMAFWIVGAPRIDKVEMPQEKCDECEEQRWVEIEALPDGAAVVPQSEAAYCLAWDRCLTEFNVGKAMAIRKGDERSTSEGEAWARLSALAASVGVRQDVGRAEEGKVRSPESISYETHAHCLLQGMQLSGADEARCWSELQEILGGCSRASG